MKVCTCGGSIKEGQKLTIVSGDIVEVSDEWAIKPRCDMCGKEYEITDDLPETEDLTLEVSMRIRKGDVEVSSTKNTNDIVEAMNSGFVNQLHASLKELYKLLNKSNE